MYTGYPSIGKCFDKFFDVYYILYTIGFVFNERSIYYIKKFVTVNQHTLTFNFLIIVRINILFVG